MPSDARGRLTTDPFEHRAMKDGTVLISRGGRVVTTVQGAAARRLLAAIDGAPDADAVQHLLARATGDYRRGNERAGEDRFERRTAGRVIIALLGRTGAVAPDPTGGRECS